MDNNTVVNYHLKKIKRYDVRTYFHCRRVASIADFIGDSIDLTSKELKELKYSALLHDIGKIRIPRQILNKPGRLLAEEWQVLKTHPGCGVDIIDFPEKRMLKSVVDGVVSHHEHFNGKGYPDGLKGEDIPLYGRIIAVADAFDAMVSFRPYRRQLDIKEALQEVQNNSGTQFDPYIVQKLLVQQTEVLNYGIYSYKKGI